MILLAIIIGLYLYTSLAYSKGYSEGYNLAHKRYKKGKK